MQSIKINEILHDVSLKKTLNLEACVNVYCFGQGILTLTQHSGEKEIILTSQYYLCSFFFFFFEEGKNFPAIFEKNLLSPLGPKVIWWIYQMCFCLFERKVETDFLLKQSSTTTRKQTNKQTKNSPKISRIEKLVTLVG